MSKDQNPGGRPRKELKGQTTTPPQNGIYYTVNEAADLLGVNKHTIQARLRDGTLKGKKLCNTWRIYKDEIQKGS